MGRKFYAVYNDGQLVASNINKLEDALILVKGLFQ